MSGEPTAESEPAKNRSPGLPFLAVAVPLLILVVAWEVRLRLAPMPLERDEGEYAYMGQLILQDTPPYSEAFGMKFPGIYAAYALMMLIFGEADTGIRFGLLVINIITALLLYRLARKLATEGSPDPLVPIWAAAAFAALSLAPTMLGVTANAEHFVILPALAGMLLLYSPARPWHWLGGGICLGIAVTMKQPGLTFAVLGIVWGLLFSNVALAHSPVGSLQSTAPKTFGVRPHVLSRGGSLCLAGFAIPLLIMVLWIWGTGALKNFWFWTITYPAHYGGMWTCWDGIRHFSSQFGPVLRDHLLLVLAAFYGLLATWQKERRQFWFVTGLLVAGFLATVPGFVFRPHYFLFIAPGFALAAALGLAALQRRFNNTTATFILAAVILGSPLLLQADTLFFADPETVCRQLYPRNAFVEARKVAAWLRDHVPAGDRIGMLGSEPEILFYSGHRSATPYLYVYPMFEQHPYAAEMQRDFMDRMEHPLPHYIIHARLPTSWLVYRQSRTEVLAWTTSFLKKYYVCEHAIPLAGKPPSQELVIYRRKP